MGTSAIRVLDRLLQYGPLLLLIWTPLAFGAVHAWAYGLLELHVFLLVALWMGRELLAQRRPELQSPPVFIKSPLTLPLALFLALLLLQIIPLPTGIIRWLSPATADLYRQFLPGWPDTAVTLSLQPYLTRTALGTWLAYASIFFLMINTLKTHQQIRVVCRVIVGVAGAIALLGVMQKLSGTDSIYWLRKTNDSYGFFGPFFNRNHFAGYQNMAFFLGLGLLLSLTTRQAPPNGIDWRRNLLQVAEWLSPERILVICALAIMTGALLLSASRGGVICLTLGLLLLSGLLQLRHTHQKRQTSLALVIVTMLGMGFWLGAGTLMQRLGSLASDQNTLSLTTRAIAFQMAWDISKAFPLLGVGYEAFQVIAPSFQPLAEHNPRFLYVHNDFLQLLAETGWVGFLLLISGIVFIVRDIIKRWRPRRDPFIQTMIGAGLASLFAIGLHSLIDFNLHIPSNALLFTVILSLTYACANLPRRGAASQVPDTGLVHPTPSRHRVLLPSVSALVALYLAFGALRIVAADLLYPQQEVFQPHRVEQIDAETRRYRLQQALTWNSQNPHYWRRLAELEVEAAQDTLTSNRDSTEPPSQAVTQLMRASEAYQHALAQQPTEPYTQFGWLQVQQALAQIDPSSQTQAFQDLSTRYTQLAALAPSDPEIQYGLGALGLNAASDDQGKASPHTFFHRSIQLDETYHHKVLEAYRSHYEKSEALRRFALAIPNTPEGHLQTAERIKDSLWPQARLHYQVALVLSQNDPNILRAYGKALLHYRDYAATQRICERLIDIDPNDAAAYLQLADAFGGLKNHERTTQTLEQLVKRFPRHPHYLDRLAKAYLRLDLSNEAEAIWKQVIDIQPQNEQGYIGLAHLYRLREDVTGAIRMMQRAVHLAPDTIRYHHTLAQLYELKGNRSGASQVYQKLATRQTEDPYTFFKLGQYAQQEGKLLSAVSYYRRAVHLKPDHTGFQNALQRAIQQGTKP